MKSPVYIEKQFQELLANLSLPVSARERLLSIKEFIDQIVVQSDAAESYLLEVVQYLPNIVRNLDINGYEPYTIRTLYENLQMLYEQHPSLSTIADFDRTLDLLRVYTAQLYAFAGNVRIMLAFLNEKYAIAPPRWINNITIEPRMTPYKILCAVENEAEKNNDPVTYEIDRIKNNWKQMRALQYCETVVPVIELSYSAGGIRSTSEGALRRIRVNIFGESGVQGDEVHPDIAVFGARLPVEQSMKVPVYAARNLVAQTHPHLKDRYVTGQVIFTNRSALHEGSSANAAIAALTYCEILKTFDQRVTYRLAPAVAITGDVDENGEILPVDEDSLYKKVRTTMFSYIDYLVVPKQQLMKAEEIVEEVKRFYPDRTISVIGIGHLQEIFFDRRLTEQNEISALQYAGRRIAAKKYTIMSLLTILVLLAIIAQLTTGPTDRNPVSGYMEGEHLVVLNESNQVIDRIRVSEEVVQYQEFMADRLFGHDWRLFLFHDVTGDGFNEVLWASNHQHPEQYTSVIYCKSIARGEILWEYPVSFDINFPRKPYATGNVTRVNAIAIDDLEGNGTMDVIVAGVEDRYFPGFILRMNAATGEPVDYYVHTGAINAVITKDITGNGIKEIIAGGVSNAFDEAVLVVLDPRNMSGHSPLRGDYEIVGYEKADEIAYVRIPRTKVGQELRHRSRFNDIYQFQQYPETNQFQVMIYEFRERDPQRAIGEVAAARYFINFNYNLEVQTIGTADGFDMMARLLHSRGILDSIPDYKYFQEYATTLHYWNGSGWQTEPVLNRLYADSASGDTW